MRNEIDDNAAACEQISRDQRTKTLPVYVHYYKDYSGKDSYSVASYDMSEYNPNFVKIGKTELVYLIPEEFDPIDQQVNTLKRQKDQITLQFMAKIKEIETQISSLTAIDFTPTEF